MVESNESSLTSQSRPPELTRFATFARKSLQIPKSITLSRIISPFSVTGTKRNFEPDTPSGLGPESVSLKQTQAYFLKRNVDGVRSSLQRLEEKVENAMSYREISTKLLSEAQRALGRLEQAVVRKDETDLFLAASHLKAYIHEGITLVKVYGGLSWTGKALTILMRASINQKFDKVIQGLSEVVCLPAGSPLPLPSSQELPNAASSGGRSIHAALTRKSAGIAGVRSNGQLLNSNGPLNLEGRVIKEPKLDKIYCLTPVPEHLYKSIKVWWSTGNKLEFWTEAGISTTDHEVDKNKHLISALGVDLHGHLWIGHAKGLLRVRHGPNRDIMAEERAFSSQVRCITFDDWGRAWVGDEDGKVKVFKYVLSDPLNASSRPSLEVVATLKQSLLSRMTESAKTMLLPRPLAACWGGGSGGGGAAAVADEPATRSPVPSVSGTPMVQDMMSEGPIRAILVRGERAWLSGGKASKKPWLVMVNSNTFEELSVYKCVREGPVNAISTFSWHAEGEGTRQQQHIHTLSTFHNVMKVTWWLLTGHENGQVIMWDPSAPVLTPLIRIGEPTTSIRGIHVFEESCLVITAHQWVLGCVGHGTPLEAGNKDVLSYAYFVGCYPTKQGDMPLSFVATRTTGRLKDSGAPNSITPACSKGHDTDLYKPNKVSVRAHRSNLIAFTGDHSWFCTASLPGTVRLWLRSDVETFVQRAGILPSDMERQGTQDKSTTPSPHPLAAQGDTDIDCQIIQPSDITLLKEIGHGAYGKVYRAEWTGCPVAVKELIGSTKTGTDKRKLWQEITAEVKMLAKCNHPNIVRFMAVCIPPNSPPMIVMQLYEHGSLFDLLKRANVDENAARWLQWSKRLQMLRDVCSGMQYLHNCQPPVIYGDLRSPNLLLDLIKDRRTGISRFHVKIADFGLAKRLNPSSNRITVDNAGNPRWAAPEAITDSQIGPASDVFMFAIIMWEIMTWKQPYHDMRTIQVVVQSTMNGVRPLMPEDRELPGHPGVTLQPYKELMEECWDSEPARRPTFKQIAERLQSMIDQEPVQTRSRASSRTSTHPHTLHLANSAATTITASTADQIPSQVTIGASTNSLVAGMVSPSNGSESAASGPPSNPNRAGPSARGIAPRISSISEEQTQGHVDDEEHGKQGERRSSHSAVANGASGLQGTPTLTPTELQDETHAYSNPTSPQTESRESFPLGAQLQGAVSSPFAEDRVQMNSTSGPSRIPPVLDDLQPSLDFLEAYASGMSDDLYGPFSVTGPGPGYLGYTIQEYHERMQRQMAGGDSGSSGSSRSGSPGPAMAPRAGAVSPGPPGLRGGGSSGRAAASPLGRTTPRRSPQRPSPLSQPQLQLQLLPEVQSPQPQPQPQPETVPSLAFPTPPSERNTPQTSPRPIFSPFGAAAAAWGTTNLTPTNHPTNTTTQSPATTTPTITNTPQTARTTQASDPGAEVHRYPTASEGELSMDGGVGNAWQFGPGDPLAASGRFPIASDPGYPLIQSLQMGADGKLQPHSDEPSHTSVSVTATSGVSAGTAAVPQPAAAGGSRGGSSRDGKPWARLSATSPFSAAQAATPPPQQLQSAAAGSSSSSSQRDGKPWAPLSATSPFSAAQAATPPPAKPAAAASSSSTSREGKAWAPLSASSPFSAAQAATPPPQELQPVAAGSSSSSSQREGKPWAPLSASSPFSTAQAPTPQQPAASKPAAAGSSSSSSRGNSKRDGKPWAPLSATSPFSAAQAATPPPQQPQSAAAASSSSNSGQGKRDGKPWAPLSASSPFSAAQAVTPQQPAASQSAAAGSSSSSSRAAKPWAPLSASSPFSAAQTQNGN